MDPDGSPTAIRTMMVSFPLFERIPQHMKTALPVLLVLLLALTACLPMAAQAPLPATETPTPIPPTATSTPTLPVLPAPQILEFSMQDGSNGWAVTASGIVRTTDGGLTWYDTTPSGVAVIPSDASFYAFDHEHAWLVLPVNYFDSGTLYVTSDGGYTWASYSAPFSGAALQFFDPHNGVAMVALGAGAGSEAVAFFKTADAGGTWTRVYINDPTIPGSADSLPLGGLKSAFAFSDPLHAWVGGDIPMNDYFYLYASQDGGATWTRQDLPWPDGRPGYFAGVEAIRFVSPEEGYIVVSLVGEFSENYIYQTTDGGQNWAQIAGMIPRSRLFTILPGPVIACWMDTGRIFYTPQGDFWYETNPDVAFGDFMRQLQFVDATTAFALKVDAASHASFYVTHDSGATWSTLIP